MDFVDFAFEHSGFARQIRRAILFRERYVDRQVLTGLLTDQLIFKPRDELTAAQFQTEIGCFTAFKCFAVDKALEIHDHDIARLGLAVFFDLLGRTIVARQFIHGVIDFFVRDLRLIARQRKRREINRLNFRHNIHSHRIDQIRPWIEA